MPNCHCFESLIIKRTSNDFIFVHFHGHCILIIPRLTNSDFMASGFWQAIVARKKSLVRSDDEMLYVCFMFAILRSYSVISPTV